MFFRGRVAACRRLLLESSFIYNIRPLLLRTDSLLSQGLDPIANKGAIILIRGAFDHALVIVDKQPAKIDKGDAVLFLEKLQCADK